MKTYWKQNRWLVFLFTLFVFAAEGIALTIARLNGKLVDLATGNIGISAPGSAQGFEPIVRLLILVTALSLLMPICFYFYTLFLQFFRVRIESAMRRDLVRSILKRSYRDYLLQDEGVYLSTYTTQIGSLDGTYFRSIFGILQIIADAFFSLLFLYFIHPPFVLYSLVGVIPAIIIPRMFEPLINRLQKKNIESVSRNITTLNEYLAGLQTITLFHRKAIFKKFFVEQTDAIREVQARIPQTMNLATNLSHLLLNLYQVVIVLVSSLEIAKGNISIGAYIASIHILSNFTGGLGFTAHYLQQFSVSRKTIRHYFDIADSAGADSKKTKLPHDRRTQTIDGEIHSIRYDHVHFSYDGNTDIIDGFDRLFTEKGIYQVVGASGGGKSTLLNLLCGYIESRSGATYLNEVPVRDVENLNDLFTIMRQEAIFFDGSLKDNVTMYSAIEEEQIIRFFERLGLSKLVVKLNDTEFTLSGGEQRRVMLIRALLRDTQILILDEPLANLDQESIRLVEQALSEIQNKFIFVITHEPLNIPVIDTIRIG